MIHIYAKAHSQPISGIIPIKRDTNVKSLMRRTRVMEENNLAVWPTAICVDFEGVPQTDGW